MGSKHGRMLTFPSPPQGALDLPHRPLNSIEGVIELLGETINRVQQGTLDLRAANSIGFLAGIHLKALAQRVEEPVGGHEPNGNELKAITSLPRTKVEGEVLEHELMRLVVGLNQNQFPKEKLEAIKAAYVAIGTLESGSTRRVIPPENNSGATENGYMSIFERLKRGDGVQPEHVPPAPLFSDVAQSTVPVDLPLPPPGESIDDPPTPPNNHLRIIRVEVG